MAKIVMIVRGPLGAEGGPDVHVVNNPQPEIRSLKQEIPSSLNEDDLMFKPPGGLKEISIKSFKELSREKEKEKGKEKEKEKGKEKEKEKGKEK